MTLQETNKNTSLYQYNEHTTSGSLPNFNCSSGSLITQPESQAVLPEQNSTLARYLNLAVFTDHSFVVRSVRVEYKRSIRARSLAVLKPEVQVLEYVVSERCLLEQYQRRTSQRVVSECPQCSLKYAYSL